MSLDAEAFWDKFKLVIKLSQLESLWQKISDYLIKVICFLINEYY